MFEYRWLDSVLDRLADIYVALDPQERDQMAAGVEACNARLATEPWDEGESRVAGYRVAFPPLLQVLFHVDVGSRKVRVVDVARYGK